MPPAIPTLQFGIQMTDVLQGVLVTGRWWNQFAREAMTEVLRTHHEQRIRLHFQGSASSRYGYKQRKGITKQIKLRYWHTAPDLALVRSGQTSRQVMSSAKISLRGAFGSSQKQGGGLQGRLTMEFPFPAAREGKAAAITQQDMKDEITRTTPEEDRQIQEQFRDLLVNKLNTHAGALRGYRQP